MGKQQPPLLLTTHGARREKQSFYSLLGNRCGDTCIPILYDKLILACTHGWLVLVDYLKAECCCLWNPESMEIIQLPRLNKPYLYNKCVLSKPPTEPDCHILFNANSTFVQSFGKIGDYEFLRHSLEEEHYDLMAIGSLQGRIYGVIHPGYKFVNVNFVGKTLELIPMLIIGEGGQPWKVPLPSLDWVIWHDNYMMDSPFDGELLLVTKSYTWCSYLNGGLDFRVFRVDINGMECVELENIGEQTIFISHYGNGFCCPSSGVEPNSIYYTEEEGLVVYIYDLGNRSTRPLPPCTNYAKLDQPLNYWVDLQDVLHQLIN